MTAPFIMILSASLLAAADPAKEKPVSYPRSIPLPKGALEPSYTRLKVACEDKIELVVHEWAPPGGAAGKPVIVFVHGIGMHGEPYAAIAAGFTSKDITLVVPDLRGHGRSGGERGKLAQPKVLRSDFDSVLDLINKRHRGAPVILMGDSMGGLLAADYARHDPKRLAALILLVPAFRVHASRLQLPPELTKLMLSGRLSFDGIKSVSFDAGLDLRVTIDSEANLNASSREPGFVKAKIADPLATHEVSVSYLLRIAQMGTEWPKAAAELKLPLLVVVAGEDQIIDHAATKDVFDRAGTPKAKKTWKKWDKAYHSLCWDPLTPDVIAHLASWTLEQKQQD